MVPVSNLLKVSAYCALCLFQRGYMEILEATEDPAVRLQALQAFIQMLARNFTSTAVPSVIGTMRERLIKEVTGNLDPCAERKRRSNYEAMKVLPVVEKTVSSELDGGLRFRKACLASIVGNIMEFHIPGHSFDYNQLSNLIHEAEKDLVIDDIPKAYNVARKAGLVLYLADNAGEIAFDTLLVKELVNATSKGRVVVAVKGKPVHNDATMEDALFVGMDKVADSLITTGTDAMGLIPSECGQEFLSYYDSADFVVVKGMGYAETLTELGLRVPHFLLLRTKCMTVANYFQVPREKNIAKIL